MTFKTAAELAVKNQVRPTLFFKLDFSKIKCRSIEDMFLLHLFLVPYLFCSYSIIHGGYQFPNMAKYEHPDNCQGNSSQSILCGMHGLFLSKVIY